LYISGDLSLPQSSSLPSSHITNNTFQNIRSGYIETAGGVLYISVSSEIMISVERCLFSSCSGAMYGGAVFINYTSSSVLLSMCRFINNTGTYGNDIYLSSEDCFTVPDGFFITNRYLKKNKITKTNISSTPNTAIPLPIDSCTSSLEESVYCYGYKEDVLGVCTDVIVWKIFNAFFILFIYFIYLFIYFYLSFPTGLVLF
jgi:hypothetical protein